MDVFSWRAIIHSLPLICRGRDKSCPYSFEMDSSLFQSSQFHFLTFVRLERDAKRASGCCPIRLIPERERLRARRDDVNEIVAGRAADLKRAVRARHAEEMITRTPLS